MRNMSFMLTTEQVRNRTKDVTRRFGWDDLEPGDLVCSIEQGQGLKKGEKVVRLAVIRVINTKREPVDQITRYANPAREMEREGFPDMTPEDFVKMLRKIGGKKRPTVNRIEFDYTDLPLPK